MALASSKLSTPLRRADPRTRAWGGILGIAVFAAVHAVGPPAFGLWLPSLGIGIPLACWFGYRVLPFLFLASLSVDLAVRDASALQIGLGSLLLVGQVGLSWQIFRDRAGGSPWLEDPLSATLFLILVAGIVPFAFGYFDAWIYAANEASWVEFSLQAATSSLARTLGVLPVAPMLLVVVTPLLQKARCLDEPRSTPFRVSDWRWGEAIELAGLAGANIFLDILLTRLHVERGLPGWALWGASLLVVVWSAIRQGLRGATLVSSLGACAALALAQALGADASIFSPLQGNLLAQSSTALMIGAAVGWIRESEIRYRHIVGHIPVVLYSVRLQHPLPAAPASRNLPPRQLPRGLAIAQDAEVTLVSPASTKVLHADPSALAGPYVAWIERVDPADREVLLAALAQLCLQDQPIDCEYRLRSDAPQSIAAIDLDRNDAAASAVPVRWVHDTLVPRRTPEGLLEGWEGILEDVTDARSLSHNLRRMTAMFQALVVNMPAGIFFVSGPTGQPVLVNARARQLLGQREELAAGIDQMSRVYRLHRPDGSEYPADELPVAVALRRGKPSMAKDVVVHRPDGKKTTLVSWAAPVDLGTPGQTEAAVWVIEDLSQLERAELARRESEARLRAVFESMAEGVVVLDAQGLILESNPAATKILGLAPAAPRTWLAPDIGCVREDGSPFPADEHPDRVALRTGTAIHSVVLGVPADGSVRWLLVHCVPLPSNLGPARLVATIDDVTASRRLQDELKASQRLELIGQIAGGIVHDFNNLLTGIVGTAEIVASALGEHDPLRTEVRRIVEIGEQAGHLANQILAFGRTPSASARSSDLNAAVVLSVRLMRNLMPHGVRIDVDLEQGDPVVPLEETQLKQVVMNLCVNARDAMPKGGKIRIRTCRREDARLPLVLEVCDEGVGMPESVRRRAFEPFFTTKERGTGLGLAAVRQIVESCGGTIEVQSETNRGTRVEVRLPERSPSP